MHGFRYLRQVVALSLVALCLTPPNAVQAATTVPASFTITGSGFGHGIGMSQYGALAMAREWEADPTKLSNTFCADKSSANSRALCIGKQINTTYFPGTNVNYGKPVKNFRVGVEQDVPNLYFINPDGALTITPTGKSALTVPVNTEVQVTSSASSGSMSVKWASHATVTSSKISIGWSAGVLHYKTSANSSYKYSDGSFKKNYKYGYMEISYGKFPASGLYADSVADLQLVNVLSMGDEYLYGLSEVSNSWPKGALIAQVIAARSYAWAHKSTANPDCLCAVFDTTGSQVFVGYNKELQTNGNLWRAAVDATIRADGDQLYVMKGTTPISAFFSSSSGGSTQPANEVWGSDLVTYSYLTGVADPWSVSEGANNPYSNWQVKISQKDLVQAFNKALGSQGSLTDIASIAIAAKYSSGGISKLDVVDSAGNIKHIYVRPNAKWVVGEIDLSPDRFRSIIGAATLLPVANSAFNGSTYIKAFLPDTGSTAGSAATQIAKIVSVPRFPWENSVWIGSSTTLAGYLTPAQASTKVELQQKTDFAWKTIATSTTNKSGKWAFAYVAENAGKKTFRVRASNSKNSANSSSKTITFSSKVTIFGSNKAGPNSALRLNGSTIPAKSGLTVIVERKVGTGPWKRIGTTKTDDYGSWTLAAKTTSYKVTTQFRARLSDSKVGKATSKIVKVSVR